MRGPAATQPTYHPARMIKVINNRRQLLESKELKSAVLRDSFITIGHSFCSIVTHSLLSILRKKPLPESPEPFPGRCFAQNALLVFVADLRAVLKITLQSSGMRRRQNTLPPLCCYLLLLLFLARFFFCWAFSRLR